MSSIRKEKDYSQREVVDKLGIKPGFAVAIDERVGQLEADLRQKILLKTGRSGKLAMLTNVN